jgi:hypothetical protein
MSPFVRFSDYGPIGKFDSGPYSYGREGIKQLLYTLMELPDVLDLKACIRYLKGARKVGVAQALEGLMLEV